MSVSPATSQRNMRDDAGSESFDCCSKLLAQVLMYMCHHLIWVLISSELIQQTKSSVNRPAVRLH